MSYDARHCLHVKGREHLEQLLETIPSMFQNNRIAESAFGAAVKVRF
jgi:protein transport protein SEC24